jgi:protein-S-isoprenylcysteine O-methyltransferase Ste14
MRRVTAAAGTAAFLVVAPGTVVGLVPWLLTGWSGHAAPAAVAAGALLTATEQLVIRGLYRYVRNPMYLAVLAGILGQALILGRPVLVGYAAIVAVAVASFARWYEEPALTRRYGEQYLDYRRRVPGWLPARPAAEGPGRGQSGAGNAGPS